MAMSWISALTSKLRLHFWAAAAVFGVVALGLFVPLLAASGLFNSPALVPIYDDAVWYSTVRLWQRGARLYIDLWDNKGPLLFWYVRWALGPDIAGNGLASELTVSPAMLIRFWLPVLSACAVFVQGAARAMRMSVAAQLMWGLCAGALLFSPRLRMMFTSESLALAFLLPAMLCRDKGRAIYFTLLATAAVLINPKCLPVFILYPYPGSLRRCRTSLLAGAALVLVAVMISIPWSADSLQALWVTRKTSIVHQVGFVDRFQHFFGRVLFSIKSGIFAPFGVPSPVMQTVIGSVMWLGASLGLWFCEGRLALAFMAQFLVVLMAGTAWSHTFLLFLPFLLLGFARLLSRGVGPVSILIGGVCAISLGFDIMLLKRMVSAEVTGSFRGQALEFAAELEQNLDGRPWISLLGNGVPVWSLRSIGRPANRAFHNYCLVDAPWARDEVASLLAARPMRVVAQRALAGFSGVSGLPCPDARLINVVESHCRLMASASEPVLGSVDIYDCPAFSAN